MKIAYEMRNSVVISKTWKARNQAKISGCTDPEIRVLYFGSKIEDTAKKAISLIGMQYNKLYRSPAELPSGTNSMSPLYRAIKNWRRKYCICRRGTGNFIERRIPLYPS